MAQASVEPGRTGNRPDRNLALELVRVTEAAALGAGRWIGRGEKESADQAAVDGMRAILDTVSMAGVVVIGEGEKDEAPMLYNGEEVGDGNGPAVDVAVDPLEGTRLTAKGQPNAIAVIAVAERGTMFFPGAAVYMDKIATGPEAIGAVDIDAPPRENVERVARGEGHAPERGFGRRARARPARSADRRAARDRLQGAPDPGRRRRAGDRGRAATDRRRPADGDRRHAGGRDRGRGAQVRRRRRPGQALAAQRRGALRARQRRLRPRPRADDRRPRLGRGRVRGGDRRDHGRAAARRPLPVGRRPSRTRSSCARARARCAASRRRTRSTSSSAFTGREYR